MTMSRGLAQRAMESPAIVAIYESRLWRRSAVFTLLTGISFDEEFDRIIRAARIDPGGRVLDLACGSGIYTRPFARRLGTGHVVGLDISRPMLAYARRQSDAERLTNLGLVRGSALELPFGLGTFDLVNCCGALHLLPDVPQVLAEVRRVLVPGGRLTMAVIRQGDGRRARRAARVRSRMLGVRSFTRAGLGDELDVAGFSRFDVLHESGLWMIAVAQAGGDDAAR